MLTRLFQMLSRLLILALVLVALMLGAARILVPHLREYKNEIAAQAARATGRTVTIQRMLATWRGLSPVLKLVGVSVTSREHPEQHLDIGQIWVRIDLLSYLLHRELRFSGVDILDTRFTLVHDADGHLYVQEFPTDPQAAPVDISAMSRVSIHDSTITWRDLQGDHPALRFSDVTLVLRNDGDRHIVSGRVLLPAELGHTLEVEARLQGTAPSPLDWQGRLYVRGQDLELARLVPLLRPDAQAVAGKADVRLWAELDAGALVSVSSELDVSGFTVQADRAEHGTLSADQLRAQLGWQRRVHGWQAAVQHLRMTAGKQQWYLDNLSAAALTRDQISYLHALASRLPLEPLRGLLAVVPGLDKPLRGKLLALQPTGEFEDVQLSLRQLPDAIRLDRLSTRFHALGIAQSGAIPAVTGLSGHVEGSPDAGRLVLDSSDSSFMDARLFRAPLHFDHLQGAVTWQGDVDGIVVSSDSVQLDNAHLVTDSHFRLQLPHDGAPVLNLQMALPRVEVGHVHDYLPARRMSPVGVRWLDRSLQGGEVHDGSVLIDGRLDQLPFDHGEGRLEVRLPVTGATLDYNEHWSPVEALDAQVDITGRQMDVISQRGRIRSAELHTVHAQIPDLVHPHLTISGDVSGALPVMLQELGSSPLGDTYGGFVDRVTASGETGLHLEIEVPLEKHHLPVSVAGRILLQGNSLALRDSDIALSAIQGRLDFNDKGIRGDGLKARLFNHPVRARVWTDPVRHHTRIALNGPLGLVDRLLPKNDPLRAVIQGDSDWRIVITTRGTPARGQPADVGLEIDSTLAGTAIDLPEPFGKPADSTRKLTLRIDHLEQAERELQVTYDDALNGLLVLPNDAQGMRLRKGVLAIGGVKAVLPDSDTLLVTGELPHFRLEDWKPHLHADGAAPSVPVRVKLHVGELELFGQQVQDTRLDLHAEGRKWIIKAAGEQLAGDISLAQSATGIGVVTLKLDQLQIQKRPDATPAAVPPQPKPASTLLPVDFPDLQVEIKKFVYGGVNFGALRLNAERQLDGKLQISQFALDSPMLALHATGEWYVQDQHSRTRTDLMLTGGRLGSLLDALGYVKIIKDGELHGDLQASWPGAPWEAKPEKMDGKLSLVIKDGQLLDVEPGATGRALGLLSLGMLPRRLLALDFTDLFGKGFAFNRIGGDIVLDSGNAWMDGLVVDGPAARIEITGRAGLRLQDYDEVVTVTPYLNSSLGLAGAIAGGPVVGAAVIVAEKLLGGAININEMARKRYTVTGSWTEPVIKPLNPKPPEKNKTHNAELFE
jgi:uncharacterized protein (TIGR02099 family)